MVVLPRPALMLVVDPSAHSDEVVLAAIDGGVNIVQLRTRSDYLVDLLPAAVRIREATRGRASLILNGYGLLTPAEIDADGLQLPEEGETVSIAREVVGPDRLIGRSVHSLQASQQAETDGADYLVAGTIFASDSHREVTPAGLPFLRAVCSTTRVPVIAIGGIRPENARSCIEAGAAGIAVVSGILRAPDPHAAAGAYWKAIH